MPHEMLLEPHWHAKQDFQLSCPPICRLLFKGNILRLRTSFPRVNNRCGLSEKMSLSTEILRKVVFGNVTVPSERAGETGRKASHVEVRITVQWRRSACALYVQTVCVEEPALDPGVACDSTPPSSFDQFIASLRDSENAIVPARRFAAALHIDMQTLARLAHVHRNTESRLAGSESTQRYPAGAGLFSAGSQITRCRPLRRDRYHRLSFWK